MGGGHIAFVADPVDVGVGVNMGKMFSCVQDIS